MKTLITIIMGIFLLTTISALYGGETAFIEFGFEPFICNTTDNLTYSINQSNVIIDIPSNFIGNFTLICFSEDEAAPVIQYRSSGGGGSSRTIYENITEYKDRDFINFVDKEVEVPVEVETIIEVTPKEKINLTRIIILLILVIAFIFLWRLYKSKNKIETQNYSYKEVQEYE